MFSTLSKGEIVILATFNFSSRNAFNLVTSKIVSFGRGLKAGDVSATTIVNHDDDVVDEEKEKEEEEEKEEEKEEEELFPPNILILTL